MNHAEILVFTPTYNESNNIRSLIEQIFELGLPVDVLVVDDNSPDGTGDIVSGMMPSHPNLKLLKRARKEGIGSAHLSALRHAKSEAYSVFISLDADFSHKPQDIPRLLELKDTHDVVVGSRFQRESSLREWNLFRRFLTHLGHFLTKALLQLPYDASGGFRLYRLDRIPITLIDRIESRDYEFFFESLALLHMTGIKIGELPVDLPARTYGHSKMRPNHMVRGLLRLFRLAWKLAMTRHRSRGNSKTKEDPDPEIMREMWDKYWDGRKQEVEKSTYDIIASFYRNYLIRPTLNHFIRRTFSPHAELVHAGCGGGEVDADVVRYAKVTAVDISPNAVAKYLASHGAQAECLVMDIFHLSRLGRRFDGLYNLGVMEHFEQDQIRQILAEFNRTLKPGGRLLLFWPPVYGLSVIALKIIHFVLNQILRRNVQLHPPEPSKVRSRSQIQKLLGESDFDLESFSFGVRDAFTYAVIVATKRP
ncbi:MAG: glycosyltransferase [Nitrospirae bacterium]|nr:MAG: glycosyltransferase [Nitrospirota bacterium]